MKLIRPILNSTQRSFNDIFTNFPKEKGVIYSVLWRLWERSEIIATWFKNFRFIYNIIYKHMCGQNFSETTERIFLKRDIVIVLYVKLCICDFFEDRLSSSWVISNLRKFFLPFFFEINKWIYLQFEKIEPLYSRRAKFKKTCCEKNDF